MKRLGAKSQQKTKRGRAGGRTASKGALARTASRTHKRTTANAKREPNEPSARRKIEGSNATRDKYELVIGRLMNDERRSIA